jgi:hypothetical protein
VWDTDQATLRTDSVDRLVGREAPLDGALDEDRDQVTVEGLDLLADEDGQSVRCGVTGAQCTVDAVMVRDGEMGESPGRRGSGDLHRVGQAVEGRRRVAVEIDERASDRAPRIDIRAGADHDLDLLHQGLLEEVEVLERKSRAQRHAVE